MPTRLKLRRLWLVGRSTCLGLAIADIGVVLVSIDPCASLHRYMTAYLVIAALLLATALLTTPSNRGRVIRWIGSLGNHSSAQQEASSVAALIGGRSIAEALFVCGARTSDSSFEARTAAADSLLVRARMAAKPQRATSVRSL
jgi:hypothetical protein